MFGDDAEKVICTMSSSNNIFSRWTEEVMSADIKDNVCSLLQFCFVLFKFFICDRFTGNLFLLVLQMQTKCCWHRKVAISFYTATECGWVIAHQNGERPKKIHEGCLGLEKVGKHWLRVLSVLCENHLQWDGLNRKRQLEEMHCSVENAQFAWRSDREEFGEFFFSLLYLNTENFSGKQNMQQSTSPE